MRRRYYKSGTGWCIWRWTQVNWRGKPYMIRLHLFKTPWFSAMLHWFLGPDPHSDPHDHPVAFVSFMLRGGYTERRYWGRYQWRPWRPAYRVREVRWLNLMPARGIHQIITVLPRTLTLVFTGPVVRRWGYHTRAGWVDWKEYGAGK